MAIDFIFFSFSLYCCWFIIKYCVRNRRERARAGENEPEPEPWPEQEKSADNKKINVIRSQKFILHDLRMLNVCNSLF